MGQAPRTPWSDLFSDWRIGTIRGQQVVRGTLRNDGPDPGSTRARFLREWDGRAYLHEPTEGPAEPTLVLLGPEPRDGRSRTGLHALLFLLTIFTTLMAGALLEGVDPLSARPVSFGPLVVPWPSGLDLAALVSGAPFALTFLTILLAHEMAHYGAAKAHGVRASLPFFIPFPPYYSVVGTLGAFIRIRGAIVRRTALLDIGAAGPAASFLLSVPAVWYGLGVSSLVPGDDGGATPYRILFGGFEIGLGDTLLLHALAAVAGPPEAGALLLHPVAFAGWLGLFVTALNLLPLGQLDGGHVLAAFAPEGQASVAGAFMLALVPLGFLWWGWWFWGVAAFALGRGRLRHPQVLQPEVPLDPLRKGIAWATILMFFLTFAPVPIVL